MPSHQIRVQQNNCEHEWKDTYGVDIANMIVAAKICIKCHEIIKLGYPGIDPLPSWHIDNIPQ